MQLSRYKLRAEKSFTFFEFISEGPGGKIKKLVKFSETNLKGFYNLAFGDEDQQTGEINDMVISNNADSEKVLATVVASVYFFTTIYPESWVYATGSTKSRTRSYRMGIAKHLADIKKDYEMFGLSNSRCENFEPGTDYEAFLVKRKK